ncbi:RagB/SusD family nutrient uptake outer membrane protein [Fulvivirga sedimenti]|uniref:RagB/SusD family nutrient uptake outer membrane protein n=1 Tax=Fulvivirga sedimenti TaxID=2879465 RepID=A0A9X1HUG4_9BACT|nr:RagB/SusD family nutrient uptake outer membrane protein [Fulvivirga sedimenti]MCA6077906.1 RagB/SusD family nutrient uptake outer membrane protein [Fulvivirga sedimenti]
MMKIYKRIFTLVLAGSMLAACEEQINVEPRDSITPEIALADLGGYDALLSSVYRRMHEFGYYGQTMILDAEALSDNLVIANNTGRYTGEVVNSVGAHVDIWGRYTAINEANTVIAGVPDVEGTDAAKNRILGEALFLRALMYHDLSKAYGYEPGQEVNGFNLSVILRTTPTIGLSDADFRERSTNTEVYAQIEQDLLAAINLLPVETGTTGFPARVSRSAAKALLARVYLFAGRYNDAANYADQVINESTIELLEGDEYLASWSSTTHGESILEFDIALVDWSTVDGVNNSMNSVTAQHDADYNPTGGQYAVAGSDDLINSIEAGDLRGDLWVDYNGNWENLKWRGEKGDYRENIPVIRISEMYLISAEGKARSNNESGARTTINELRAARDLDPTSATGAALVDLIMNERRVELAFEGHRWFDLKRLGMDIPKPQTTFGQLDYTDFRMIARIPVDQVVLNESLQQNPGY